MLREMALTPILIGFLIAGLALPAVAGGGGHDCPMRGGMDRGMHMGRMMDGEADRMLDRIDGRLAFIKAEIKITEAQSEAWSEFADAIKSSAETRNNMMREHHKEMRSGEFSKKPLPERLELQEARMSSRLDQIKVTRQALGKLYDVLEDQQKATANDVVLPMMGMGRGMRRMMRKGRKMGHRRGQ